MSSKNISVILNLNDKYTAPLLKVVAKTQKATEGMTKAEKQAIKESNKLAQTTARNANRILDSVQKTTNKVKSIVKKATGLLAGTILVGGTKIGFSAGAELETLRANIETVTKSAERASEVMKYAVNMANFSAFGNAELIESAAMLETYGLKTEKYLSSIGDAAAITGRNVTDMAKAFGKAAVSGQFDSLADIGITRDTLNQYAQSKGIKLFSGTKIIDKDVFADTLAEFMDSRYAGGMKKQASTITGMWSTVKGVAENALASMVGVTASGTIKMGSLFDRVRKKISEIMDTLTAWESDGTMEKIAAGVANGFDAIWKAGEIVVALLSNPIFQIIAGTLAGYVGIINALVQGERLLTAAKAAGVVVQNALNISLNACPIGWILGLIALAIGAITAVILNWDKLKAAIQKAWQWIKDVFAKIGAWFKNLFGYDGKSVDIEVNAKTKNGDPIPSYYSGTAYHPGGLARINDRGGEIVDLPNGARVIPAQQTRNILRGGNTIQIFISGAQRSDEELAEIVAERVLEAVENT